MVGIHRHRADLGPAGRMQALPGHGDESTPATDADVAAELVGAGAEGARLIALDDRHHLGCIVGAELDGLVEGAGLQRIGLDELHTLSAAQVLPALGDLAVVAREPDLGAGPDERAQGVPHPRFLPRAHRDERRDVGRIPAHQVAADRERRVRAGERVPRGVVEDGRIGVGDGQGRGGGHRDTLRRSRAWCNSTVTARNGRGPARVLPVVSPAARRRRPRGDTGGMTALHPTWAIDGVARHDRRAVALRESGTPA